MTLQIKRTGASDYGQFTKALICGSPGAGKTLISSTWPSPLYASAEGGLMSIADRNIPYVNITSSQDLFRFKSEVDQSAEVREKTFGFPVETVVIDTIDEVQRIYIKERLKNEKKEAMTLPDWGWLGEQMNALITGFRNLDLNVVFTCHLKENSDSDSGKVWFTPGLQGAISSQIAGKVDLALLLKTRYVNEIVGDHSERRQLRILQTVPDPQHDWIKDRSGKLPAELEVNFADDFTRINEMIFGGIKLPQHEVVEIDVVESPKLEDLEMTTEDSPAIVETPKREVATPKAAEKAPEPTPEPPSTEIAEGAPDEGGTIPRNKLPVGVEPISKGYGTNIYCTECGGEVEKEDQADLSRIRFRRILDRPCFDQAKR